ncbi:hypothetical protein [Anaerosolibacter carboniphilus]|uniref:hypothetical protein n=1 Tax=Anaerosolibacter carboniphilus TaxID=1417629 RepID=UPI001A9BFE0B|nr:hypothetical protein [Anaerosolibacter carboniphilus]
MALFIIIARISQWFDIWFAVLYDYNNDKAFKRLASPNAGINTFEELNNKDVSVIPNLVLEYTME